MYTAEEQLRLVGYKALQLDSLKRIEEEGPQCVPDLNDHGYGIDRTGRLHVVLSIGKDVALISQINNLTDRWTWFGFGKLTSCYQAAYIDLLNVATIALVIKRDPTLSKIAEYSPDIALALVANVHGCTVTVRGIPTRVAIALADRAPIHCILGAGVYNGEVTLTHDAWMGDGRLLFEDDQGTTHVYDAAAGHVLLLLNSNEVRGFLLELLATVSKS